MARLHAAVRAGRADVAPLFPYWPIALRRASGLRLVAGHHTRILEVVSCPPKPCCRN